MSDAVQIQNDLLNRFKESIRDIEGMKTIPGTFLIVTKSGGVVRELPGQSGFYNTAGNALTGYQFKSVNHAARFIRENQFDCDERLRFAQIVPLFQALADERTQYLNIIETIESALVKQAA